jgi:hypothetical protein
MAGKKRSTKSPLERKATQHHEFIGEATAERAQAQEAKEQHLAKGREQEIVREMAQKLEETAEKPELRIPRSLEEGKRLIADAPDLLREKAQERLDSLPPPAHQALDLAQSVAVFFFAPLRLGIRLTRTALQVPGALFQALRRSEA